MTVRRATAPADTAPAAAVLWCALALAALVAALVATLTGGGTLRANAPLRVWYPVDAALFALAVVLLRRVRDPRRTVALVLAGSIALAAAGLLVPPRTSDDAYRYLWDGRVQAAGISPYTYAPAAPALAGLRAADPALFPVGSRCRAWNEHPVGPICTHVNRPKVHTIYPPVAEVWFLGLYEAGRVTGGHGVRTAQAAGALLAVLTTGALLLLCRRIRAPLHRAALWGWFPGVALWAVNDAHVDALDVLLVVVGLAAAREGTRVGRLLGGVLLGAAVATKLYPGLALPGAMPGDLRRGFRPGRRELLLPAVAVLTFLVCYLPYVLASGLDVIGYLPGYLQAEGYEQGNRFGLLTLLHLPSRLLPLLVAAILLGAVAVVLRRGDQDRPWSGALLVMGTALFLTAPGYPWYALLVVALVVLDGRWEWLGLPAAAVSVVVGHAHAQQPGYAAALCLVLAGTAVRSLLRTAELCASVPVSAPAVTPPAATAAVPEAAPEVVPTRIRTGSSR